MKTILKYEFDDNDTEDKLNRIIHCDDAYSTLYEISMVLRSDERRGGYSGEVGNYIEKLREKFYDILSESNIDLDRDFS